MRIAIYIFLFFGFCLKGYSQKKEQIELLGANELLSSKHIGNKARRLIGNVRFKHKEALMYCDSAYMYSNNTIDAFGNVRINQGDTLNLYGDFLNYNGDNQLAIVKGEIVTLENKDFVLTSDILKYNRAENIADYTTGGKLVSKNDSNVLTSQYGHFYTNTSVASFKKNVLLVNPDFTINSDTLKYFTKTEMVHFLGPTTITGDSNLIYCETGWYDTKKDQSEYFDNAYIISDGKKLLGDTLFYDRNIGLGRASHNIEVIDTANQIIVSGDKGFLFEEKDSAIVTNSCLLTQIIEKDSLFMVADTFKFLSADSSRMLLAYNKVKFYKSDLQGICDSVAYKLSDSLIQLYEEPTLWSEENQLTSERVDIRLKNKKMHSIFMNNNAFVISEVDSVKYNQVKGKEMTAFFKESELSKIEVRGNGQTTYFGQDEKEKFIGVNVAESTDIDIRISDNEIQSITFLNQPKATMYPMGELDAETELRYSGFKWLVEKRPKSKAEIILRNISE